jgi:hypothetical protein
LPSQSDGALAAIAGTRAPAPQPPAVASTAQSGVGANPGVSAPAPAQGQQRWRHSAPVYQSTASAVHTRWQLRSAARTALRSLAAASMIRSASWTHTHSSCMSLAARWHQRGVEGAGARRAQRRGETMSGHASRRYKPTANRGRVQVGPPHCGASMQVMRCVRMLDAGADRGLQAAHRESFCMHSGYKLTETDKIVRNKPLGQPVPG